MIKLQDFARQQGVTDRAIQKHLRKYADEFEGLIERKGPNGTWLSDKACELLRSKMITPPPPVVYDGDPRVPRLETRVAELEAQLTVAQSTLTEAQGQVLALQGARAQLEAAERDKTRLEAAIGEHKARAEALEAANASLSAEIAAQKQLLSDERTRAKKASDELTEALSYAAALEAWMRLPWYRRIRTPRPTR